MSSPPLRLGTRASALARWQAEWVAAQLTSRGTPVELVPIVTQGDVTTGPLGQIGGQGLFTKELQRALLAGQIDLAVHSLKDLPTADTPGLTIAAVPPRETTADALIARERQPLDALPPAARIGTGSLRRKAQLLHLRPDLVLLEIRGNVDTRLRKLDEGQYDAIVLAEAGLKRLNLAHRITERLPPPRMLPAVGQGALGIETRADDAATRTAVAPLCDRDSYDAVTAERALLLALRAGCLAPVAALAQVAGDVLRLDAIVLSADGRQRLAASASGTREQAAELGQRVAQELLAQGAAGVIAEARGA